MYGFLDPLGRSPGHRSRRRLLVFALLLTLSALRGSHSAAAQEQDAQALLQHAAAAMAEVQSFQFKLSNERGNTTILDQLQLGDVSGGVERPDRFRATAQASLAGFASLDVEIIGVGTQVWITNPLGQVAGDGEYIELDLTDAVDARMVVQMFNPDRLLLRAIEVLQEPVIRGEDEIDGVKTTVIQGWFDPATALDVLAGTPTAAGVTDQTGVGLAGPVPVLVWIDEGGLVRRIRIEGPLLEGEGSDVVRRLDVFAYDEPLDIQAPA